MTAAIMVCIVSFIVAFFPILLCIFLTIIKPIHEVEDIFLRREDGNKDQ